VFDLFSSVFYVKRLVGRNGSETTYSVSNGTQNLNSINQSTRPIQYFIGQVITLTDRVGERKPIRQSLTQIWPAGVSLQRTWKPRLHDTTCRQTRCQTGCQTRLTTDLTTGWMFVYTIQPVVKPVRLYRVNGVEDYRPTRNSRSAFAPLLNRPHVNNVFSSSACSVSAPTVWISLQSRTRSSETYATFRNRLKTELFQKSYDTWHCGAIAALLIRMRLTVFLGALQVLY